jgi:hypothetical protein
MFGWVGFEPDQWEPRDNLIFPFGVPTVFFNAEGIIFYTDVTEIIESVAAYVTFAKAREIYNAIKFVGRISELGRIRELAIFATRASSYQLQTRVQMAEATGGRF